MNKFDNYVSGLMGEAGEAVNTPSNMQNKPLSFEDVLTSFVQTVDASKLSPINLQRSFEMWKRSNPQFGNLEWKQVEPVVSNIINTSKKGVKPTTTKTDTNPSTGTQTSSTSSPTPITGLYGK